MGGLFGVCSKDGCVLNVFIGTDYHSHTATEFGGMAFSDGEKIDRKIHNIRGDHFKSKFSEDYTKMRGKYGIGVISSRYEQPILEVSKFGTHCIAVDGRITNAKELASDLIKNGISFSEIYGGKINQTELVGKLITREDDIIKGIKKMYEKIKGSASLLMLTNEGIYATGDVFPLTVGKKEGAFAVTSETTAFSNLEFEIERMLPAHEVVLLNEFGIHKKSEGYGPYRYCRFKNTYFDFPASNDSRIDVEIYRENIGKIMAVKDMKEGLTVDFVGGVPDSGSVYAIGYAITSGQRGIPYRRPFVKYTSGWGRSFTPPTQELREFIAKYKLVPVKGIIKNKKMVLTDDSIVRRTQLKAIVKTLFDYGAKEVHGRIGCPPLIDTCPNNFSTREKNELGTYEAIMAIEGGYPDDVTPYIDPTTQEHQKMVDWIRDDIGFTSLKYTTLDDMNDVERLYNSCVFCWTGKERYPAFK